MNDLISRQAAIDALEAQERQRATQKRRYTFGNDEFSLEAAYHDCKLVFDGITDDDSFQEADTGLILYYANEIIYALHEALEGKDTNVLSNDCISRQAAIDYCYALINAENPSDPSDEWNYSQERINQTEVILHHLEFLPSAQPARKKGEWKHVDPITEAMSPKGWMPWYCSECGCGVGKHKTFFCPSCGADMRGEQNG